MPDVDLPLPFEAYSGREPFVFVSYAHREGALVFEEISYLHQAGYRVWYDEGIDPGNEWPEAVAQALSNAAQFLVFVSPNVVASRNVRNEINFALNRGMPFLAVHLTETELPAGLALRMGDPQALMKHRMTEANYRKKLREALPESCIQYEKATEIGEALQNLIRDRMHRWFGDVHMFFSENGELLIAQMSGKPVGAWEALHVREQAAAICDRILKWNQEANPWRPVADISVSLGSDGWTRPRRGQWWEVTSGYGPRPYVDIKCLECGHETDFTPSLRERPPARCPRCGSG